MDTIIFNKLLIDRIASLVGADEVLDFLCKELNKGRSSVYKKMRGEIEFSTEELIQLVRRLNLSLDHIILEAPQHLIAFDLPFRSVKIQDAGQFIRLIAGELNLMSQYKHFHVYYATREIPLFYHFYYPNLARFKAYAFMRTAWDLPSKKQHLFSLHSDIFNAQFDQLSVQLISGFSRVPSREFWNMNVLDTTLFQLEYFLQAGLFKDPGEAILILESIYALTADLAEMCSRGSKMDARRKFSEDVNFTLFINDLTHTGNVILAKSEEQSTFYITLDNPNYIKSSDKDICDYAAHWMERLETFSERISNKESRASMRLFNHLQLRISQTEKIVRAYV